MLQQERQQGILEFIEKQGRVYASQLSRQYQVSEDTIRRDLDALAQQGVIQRVHGGALAVDGGCNPLSERLKLITSEKQRIAQHAAQQISPQQIVLLDASSICLELARQLPKDLAITVVTPCAPVATALADHPNVELILLGGRVLKAAMVSLGESAIELLSTIRIDLCFMGVQAAHPETGLTLDSMEEAELKRKMVSHSAEVIALAEAVKLERTAPFSVASVQQIDQLITDRSLNESLQRRYQQAGVPVSTV